MSFPRNKFSGLPLTASHALSGFRYTDLTGTTKKVLAMVMRIDPQVGQFAAAAIQACDGRISRNVRPRVIEDVSRIPWYQLLQKDVFIGGPTDDVTTGQLETLEC